MSSELKIKNYQKIKYKTLFLILYHIITITILLSSSRCTQKIYLKIEGTGNIPIFSSNFFINKNIPDEIYINNISQTQKNREYNFNDAYNNINNVTLIWNKMLDTTYYMFDGCNKIIEIDFSEFDTSLVTKMSYMFRECSLLKSLNLSKFITNIVQDMAHMFNGCSLLVSLDLSNFDTSKVDSIDYMFTSCSSLVSLDLSNFNTSLVQYASNMFEKCSSLISLNISNFDTTNFKNIEEMFRDCTSLVFLNLSNFNTSKVVWMNYLFYNCPKLEFVNLQIAKINTKERITNMFVSISDNFILCSKFEDWKQLITNQKKLICVINNTFSEENEYLCFKKNNNPINNKYVCELCGNNFYIRYDNNNNYRYIYCYENPEGYYLDINDFYYKLCYFSCKTCEINGNDTQHNCLECKDNYYSNETNNNSYYKNCYEKINNEITTSLNYDESFSSLISNSSLNTITNTGAIILNNTLIEELIKTFQNFMNYFLNNLNLSNVDNEEDIQSEYDEILFIFTSTSNQIINEEKNNITLNFGDCVNELKSGYNISSNDSLYILEIISQEDNIKIPKIEYEIYYPFNNNLTKLNLSYCKNNKIEISIKVEINESLNKYNPKSEYYNDICSTTTSKLGTDISLKDRRNEFVDNNMFLCEENCTLIEYNYNTSKAKCSCDIKIEKAPLNDIKFNKKDFFKSFTNIKNIMNLAILKCYKSVLKLNILIKNQGFFIISAILILYFITLFIFAFKSYIKLKHDINNMIKALKNEEINNNSTKKEKKRKSFKKNIANPNKNKKNKNKKNLRNSISFSIQTLNKSEKTLEKRYTLNQKNNTNINEFLVQKDFELDLIEYKEALIKDKRTYCEYYLSLLKNKHPLIFSFATYIDYNLYIVKIFLFFFSFSLNLTVNALFFNDDTMHKIYEDKGKFNFLYQIPQIIYSTLISIVISIIIKKLALSQKKIMEIKKEKNKNILDKKYYQKLLKNLKIRFVLFFIISFLILLFFLYYITCFCGVYINTQTHLIKDSVISLITSLFIPLIICLIPGIFRIYSLKGEKPNKEYAYKFSIFLENYIC